MRTTDPRGWWQGKPIHLYQLGTYLLTVSTKLWFNLFKLMILISAIDNSKNTFNMSYIVVRGVPY